jgi:hypothetical protein
MIGSLLGDEEAISLLERHRGGKAMQMNSAKPRRWAGVAATSVLALVVAILGVLLVQGDARAAGSFHPEVDAQVSYDEHNANADITTIFNVPGTDYNYKVLVSFTPSEFIPEAADVPIGAKAGTIDSKATLGLLNGPCSTPLSPHFDLLWASTNTSQTCTFDEQFEDSTTPGLKKGVVLYPDLLTRMLPGITPVERLWGWANVSGTLVSISLVILEPGSLGYPADYGWPSISVLNDIGDPGAIPAQGDAITDFCTPLDSTTVVYGMSKDNAATAADESGHEVRRNPAYGGTYTFRWYTESFADADGDGYENYLDTCPFDVNLDASPKLSGSASDPDGDGIDSACDPAPATPCWPGAPGPMANDCDFDGYYNRGDNCPLVANGPVEESPPQKDSDTDEIGDACDTHPNQVDGKPIKLTLEADVAIRGPAAPTPTPTATAEVSPTPTVVGSPTPVVETPTPTVPSEYCSPVFPGTYNGLVRINGQPAVSGYEVTASIDGVQWGSALVSGGRYAMDIPDHLPTAPPCFEGGTITFALDGMTCTPTADWASGISNVDLSCAPAAPTTPTPAVTPTATPPVTPTPKVTPTTVPPTGAGGLSGPSSGLPVWAMALAGWAGLMIVAGLGTLAAAKRR